MEPRESSERFSKLIATGSRLAVDVGTAEVSRHFRLTGVRALLLKGPSTVRWLYSDGELRSYLDCDLLTAPRDFEKAEQVLTSLAFRRHFDDRDLPAWWRGHATAWVRESDEFTVDLHHTLPGVGVGPAAAWGTLSRDTDTLAVAGQPVETLTLAGRALHVALHAAHHGVAWGQQRADLQRALIKGDDELWLEAAAIAAELEATEAFTAGLRLVPAGVDLASRLGLSATGSLAAQLRAASAPSPALGLEQLARTRGVKARAEFVWRKLVPPASFIRHWDGRAAESRVALVLAYVRRPVWIARQMPGAVKTWLRGRRSARRTGSQ